MFCVWFPLTGLTCIQQNRPSDGQNICVLQLTEAGDIFYQVLERQLSEEPVPQEGQRSSRTGRAETLAPDTSSDEDVVGPSQAPTARPTRISRTAWLVPETPEQERLAASPSEESDRDRELDPDSVKRGTDAETKEDGRISSEASSRWRRWLHKLWQKNRGSARTLRLRRVRLRAIRARSEADREPAGRELSEAMALRFLLLASADPDHQVAPLLDGVDTDAWSDRLSRRLTASWEGGEAAWQAWWRDELGLDRQKKAEALLRRRRREKAARRASRGHRPLPDSFASSAADLAGWSSHGSGYEGESAGQGPDSCAEDPAPSAGPASSPGPASLPLPFSQGSVGSKVKDYLSSLCALQVGEPQLWHGGGGINQSINQSKA